MMNKEITTAFLFLLLVGCKPTGHEFDASGTFESDEVVVSAQASGQLLSFTVEEGQSIPKDSIVGTIDPTDLTLQKEQAQASIRALNDKTTNAGPQIKMLNDQLQVQQTQLDNLLHEQART